MGPKEQVFGLEPLRLQITVEILELSEFPKEEKKGAKAGFKKTFLMRMEGKKEREQKHAQLFKSQPAPCCQKRKVLDPSARRKMHLGTAPWDMLFNLLAVGYISI